MNNIHIKALSINNYRGLKNIQLNNFTTINVITGNNNSGKTSVMELISVIDNPLSLASWVSNLRTHSEFQNISYYEGFIDLFDSQNKEFSYSVIDNENRIHLVKGKIGFLHEQISVAKANKLTRIRKFRNEDKIVDANVLNFSMQYNENVKNYQIYDFQELLDLREDKSEETKKILQPVIYVSPVVHAQNLIFLDEILNNPLLYQEMLDVLKVFDSDIISINYTRNEIHSYYVLLSKKFNKALPLNVYGDGMKKAILLMSAVIAAKGGILLIDEFETAIHTSAMEKVYGWILKTCKKLDVQLFLTTHSKEALDKVLLLSEDEELKGDISLFTLFNIDNKNLVRKLDAEKAIEAEKKFGQELR